MSIEPLVQRPVRTLPAGATCAEAAFLMRDENVGSVIVTHESRPIGIVTDRDLAVRVMAEQLDPTKTLLENVMSEEPIFLAGDRSLDQVLSAMRSLAIRRVPVVDAAGRVTGIVSMDDVILMLADQLGDLAQAIRQEIESA